MTMKRDCGLHLLLTLKECSLDKLEGYDILYQLLAELPSWIGMTLIDRPRLVYYTPPKNKPGDNYGLSGFAMLAESHVSLHTWPEYKKVYLDVFSCKAFDTLKTTRSLIRFFEGKIDKIQIVQR